MSVTNKNLGELLQKRIAQITQPQPEVGAREGINTGSGALAPPHAFASPAKGPAVAAPPPADAPTSAGGRDELPLLSINQDGELTIGDAADPARLVFNPDQVLALGDFLRLTEPLWRR